MICSQIINLILCLGEMFYFEYALFCKITDKFNYFQFFVFAKQM